MPRGELGGVPAVHGLKTSPTRVTCLAHASRAGKKSKEEMEKAAVEQEALTKITTALEAGAVVCDACVPTDWCWRAHACRTHAHVI